MERSNDIESGTMVKKDEGRYFTVVGRGDKIVRNGLHSSLSEWKSR
jgi:hypothetical protein